MEEEEMRRREGDGEKGEGMERRRRGEWVYLHTVHCVLCHVHAGSSGKSEQLFMGARDCKRMPHMGGFNNN